MITLEQVDKLRQKANVSYDEAKSALEATNGDILEALINLEKQGKVAPPEGGGHYSSAQEQTSADEKAQTSQTNSQSNKENLADLLRKFVRFCGTIIHRGNINSVEVLKDGEVKTAFSITVLVLLAIFFFWVTVPLIIIGLFFGFRYRLRGPDLGRDAVNNAMDTAADAAENLKKTFSGGQH